jgi:hypothetical protein
MANLPNWITTTARGTYIRYGPVAAWSCSDAPIDARLVVFLAFLLLSVVFLGYDASQFPEAFCVVF